MEQSFRWREKQTIRDSLTKLGFSKGDNMQELFDKINERFVNILRVVKNDEDLEWNRAVCKCSEIVNQVVEEQESSRFRN